MTAKDDLRPLLPSQWKNPAIPAVIATPLRQPQRSAHVVLVTNMTRATTRPKLERLAIQRPRANAPVKSEVPGATLTNKKGGAAWPLPYLIRALV